MDLIVIKNWLKSFWVQILPIVLSIIAVFISLYYSKKAVKISKESLCESKHANEIAETVRAEAEKRFAAINRPLIIVEPVKSQETKEYFEMEIGDGKISIVTVISIENGGSIIAGNTFVHSSTGVLFINDKQIARDEQKYKPLNKNDNLSALHIAPNQNHLRGMKYTFQLPHNFPEEEIRKETVGLIQNILIYYYSDTKQMSHELAKDFHYHTNVSHRIRYNGYAPSMQMF